MWTSWEGELYRDRRLLILGESCYDWVEDGDVMQPQHDHPITLVNGQLKDPREQYRFMTMLTRALTGENSPDKRRRHEGWRSVSFTNYVPISVGVGSRIRPSREAWQQALIEWPKLLEKLRPREVIVLGYDTWRGLPPTELSFGDEMDFNSSETSVTNRWRGYRLDDGSVTRCWSHWHPAAGASWQSIRDAVAKAEATPIPADWKPL